MPEPGDPPGTKIRTLYACAQCGRDRTDAWEAVQPPKPEPPAPEPEAPKTIAQEAHELGIAATHNGDAS
jgi:hypothetical protein